MKTKRKIKQHNYIGEYAFILNLLDIDTDRVSKELNSEAGRGSGRNVHFIIALNTWMLKYPDKKFNISVYRKQTKDLKDIWDDFEQWNLIEWDIKHKYQEASINGNKITFGSLYTSAGKQQSGLGKSMMKDADYTIVWTDECTELVEDDFHKIGQSVTRFGGTTIKLRSWNTWSPHNYIVKYMAGYMPYPGVEYMKKHLIQKKKVYGSEFIQRRPSDPPKEVKTVKYFMRGAAPLNPYSPDGFLSELYAIAKINPDEGDTILWAKPRVVDGAVYRGIRGALIGINDIKNFRYKRLIAGIDFGISDATTVSLVGLNSDDNIRTHGLTLLGEYYHANEKGKVHKDLNTYADEVVAYLLIQYNQYQVYRSTFPFIKCVVDYARQTSKDELFVDLLRQRAIELGVEDKLIFEKATKDRIRDRIQVTNYLLAAKRLHIVEALTPNLVRELEESYYDTNRLLPDGGHPRADGNDHIINAFEYALSEVKDELHTPYSTYDKYL